MPPCSSKRTNYRRVWHPCHTHAAFLLRFSPTEFTEFTEPSRCDFLPQISQICTEASYCDFLPQISQICTEPSYCDFLPQISQIWTESSYCDFLPQISLICTEPSRCDFLLQISQICTEPSCREGSPTDSTDLHRCRRVWHLAVPTQPTAPQNFCEFCGFRGRINATNHLC